MKINLIQSNKKAASILVMLLLCLTMFCSTLLASDVKVYDYANLFTIDEITELEATIASLSSTYQMDIGIVTTDDVKGKTTMAYADDFYDENGYGIGSHADGLLFLIDMDNRVPHISTCGSAIKYFTDSRLDRILDNVYDDLANGDYYGAANSFLSQVQGYLDAGIPNGQYTVETTPPHVPFKTPYGEPLNAQSIVLSVLAALLGASVIALIVRSIVSYSYKKPKYTAPQTQPDNMSIHYTEREDRFVTSHTSRVKIQTDNNSHSGGGSHSSGRSSVHTSSSGHSHGGSTGRKF